MDMVENERGVQCETEQEVSRSLREPTLPVCQFVADSGSHQRKQIADNPNRSNRLQRLIREAGVLRKDSEQHREQAHQRQRKVEICIVEGATAVS